MSEILNSVKLRRVDPAIIERGLSAIRDGEPDGFALALAEGWGADAREVRDWLKSPESLEAVSALTQMVSKKIRAATGYDIVSSSVLRGALTRLTLAELHANARAIAKTWNETQPPTITSKDLMSELVVTNFRHINELRISPFGRVTLIGGKNNTGKTALLEALWQIASPRADLAMTIDRFTRGLGQPQMMEWQFSPTVFSNKAEGYSPIEISAGWDPCGGRRSIKLELETGNGHASALPNFGQQQIEGLGYKVRGTFTAESGETYVSKAWSVIQTLDLGVGTQQVSRLQEESDVFPEVSGNTVKFLPARFREPPHPIAELFGDLVAVGKEKPVMDFLRHVEPSLSRLMVLPKRGVSVVHASIGDRLPIPVNLVGEGFTRMLEVFLSAMTIGDGLLLVDEIENGLHFTIHEDIFASLHRLAEETGLQVVATTHSRELVLAAHKALKDKGDNALAYHRIDSRDGEISVASFDMEMLETVDWFGMEVR